MEISLWLPLNRVQFILQVLSTFSKQGKIELQTIKDGSRSPKPLIVEHTNHVIALSLCFSFENCYPEFNCSRFASVKSL